MVSLGPGTCRLLLIFFILRFFIGCVIVNFINYLMKHQGKMNSTHASFFSKRSMSRSKEKCEERGNLSLKLKVEVPVLEEYNPEVYFNNNKRKVYLKNVVDKYFSQGGGETTSIVMDSIRSSKKSIRRKDVFSSQCKKRKKIGDQPVFIGGENQAKPFMFNLSSLETGEGLPTINEFGLVKRPTSEHYSRRSGNLRKYQQEDSLFNDSTRSVYGMQEQETDIKSYKTYTKDRDVRKKMKLKYFLSDSDQHFIRVKLIKKHGYKLLLQPTQKMLIFQYPVLKTVRQQCYSIVEDRRGDQPLFLMFPKEYYWRLFVNQCQELKDVILGVAKNIMRGKGVVANNMVALDNLYKMAQKDFVVGEWGYSAIKEVLKVQDQCFTKYHLPLCKMQDKWLVEPEYLAPQMLRAIEVQSFQHLWGQKGGIGACDVWSLGCMIVELITLIPITQPHHCIIKGSTYSRRGLLAQKPRNVPNILQKQRHFRSLSLRRIKDHIKTFKIQISPSILDLLPKMLELDAINRVQISQIVKILT